MIHLRAAQFRQPTATAAMKFPFTIPAIAALAGTTLNFPTPMTFFIGENGSGKSTILETLACAIGSITVGSEQAASDPMLNDVQALAKTIRLQWNAKTKRGFFLRSEDFFGYAKRMKQVREELERDRAAIAAEEGISDYAKALGMMPYNREIADMERRYGASLDAYSHGESFFRLFNNRFVPGGLYLLDEPEAPLSPMRQLAFIAMLKEMVADREAQFIIATHSPIVMAFPGATIYACDDGAVRQTAYDQIEHVTLTRDFLRDPEQFLRHL